VKEHWFTLIEVVGPRILCSQKFDVLQLQATQESRIEVDRRWEDRGFQSFTNNRRVVAGWDWERDAYDLTNGMSQVAVKDGDKSKSSNQPCTILFIRKHAFFARGSNSKVCARGIKTLHLSLMTLSQRTMPSNTGTPRASIFLDSLKFRFFVAARTGRC
jgi:hypothetical protein